MKISYNWLQKHIDGTLPEPKALEQAIIFHAFEVESVEAVGDDTVFDIKVLPDRAHDCLSHQGIAREVAALFNLKIKNAEIKQLPALPLALPIEVQSTLCRRYRAVLIKGVTVGPSPEWLRRALESVGQRSINNIVDATNFVLLDGGQPVHAFDVSKIEKGIVVRTARSGERMVTLSGEEKDLTEETLVIADYLQPIAIAGVKGGKSAEVNEKTKDILIEVANFNAVSVRKTARRLNLLTDAAKRFENDLSPAVADTALEAVVALIAEIASGSVVGVFEYYPTVAVPWQVQVTVAGIARLLGEDVTLVDITITYDRYAYQYDVKESTVTITPPLARLDLLSPADVAEDVARMMGYDLFKPKLFSLPTKPTVDETFARIVAAKAKLVGAGYNEVMTYSFTKKGEVEIAYASKEQAALRTNVLDGLHESYERNLKNKELLNTAELKLFEIGIVFLKDTEEMHVATIDAAGEKETTLEQFIAEVPASYAALPRLAENKKFKMWSLYPYIVRDVAVWIAENDRVVEEKLFALVQTFAKANCIAGPFLFDTFTKDMKKSIAYRFIFQSYEKTLTDEEVNKQMETLYETLKKEGFEIR